jgi:hypothetical protein
MAKTKGDTVAENGAVNPEVETVKTENAEVINDAPADAKTDEQDQKDAEIMNLEKSTPEEREQGLSVIEFEEVEFFAKPTDTSKRAELTSQIVELAQGVEEMFFFAGFESSELGGQYKEVNEGVAKCAVLYDDKKDKFLCPSTVVVDALQKAVDKLISAGVLKPRFWITLVNTGSKQSKAGKTYKDIKVYIHPNEVK